MTKEELREIALLCAKKSAEKKAVLDGLDLRNSYGMTPEERIDADAAQRLARAEWSHAEAKYCAALSAYAEAL